MVQTFTKTRNYATLAIVLFIAIMAVGANSSLVAADPCIAQLNYPVMPTSYSYSNLPVSVPISATCTTYYGTQLYATGNAYDVTANTGLGTVSTALQSNDGGNTFNGQLTFNVPSSTQGHTIQFSVSIYNGQNGNQITSTSETLQLGFGGGSPQVITTTVTQAYPYPYQNEYYPQNQSPYPNPASSYPYPQQQSSHPNRNWNDSTRAQYLNRIQDSSRLFELVAIAAILAAVIIATAGLVVYGRRQQPVAWIPPPPPPR